MKFIGGGQEDYDWEQKKKEIAKKLDMVTSNLIDKERFDELDSSDKDEDKKELEKHIVVANNMSEWIELNRQMRDKYNLDEDWVNWEYLAHENAHAATAIQEGFSFKKYAIAFWRAKSGEIGATPYVSLDVNLDNVENIEKDIRVVEAPNKFGDSEMSKGDLKLRDELLLKK